MAALPSWPLPPVRYGPAQTRITSISPSDFNLAALHGRSGRTTPMLDTFFASDGAAIATEHRRSAQMALGDIDISLQSLRQRTLKEFPFSPGHETASKLWSAGVQMGWTVGADHLWAGLADARRTLAQPDALIGRGHQSDTEMAVGAGWQHGSHLRLDLDWLRTSGSSSVNGAERMAQLANGAPLHESGYRAAVGWALTDAASGTASIFGVEARTAHLARDDAQWLGTNRADTRLGIFLRTSF